jgi:hypothetical protein
MMGSPHGCVGRLSGWVVASRGYPERLRGWVVWVVTAGIPHKAARAGSLGSGWVVTSRYPLQGCVGGLSG